MAKGGVAALAELRAFEVTGYLLSAPAMFVDKERRYELLVKADQMYAQVAAARATEATQVISLGIRRAIAIILATSAGDHVATASFERRANREAALPIAFEELISTVTEKSGDAVDITTVVDELRTAYAVAVVDGLIVTDDTFEQLVLRHLPAIAQRRTEVDTNELVNHGLRLCIASIVDRLRNRLDCPDDLPVRVVEIGKLLAEFTLRDDVMDVETAATARCAALAAGKVEPEMLASVIPMPRSICARVTNALVEVIAVPTRPSCPDPA